MAPDSSSLEFVCYINSVIIIIIMAVVDVAVGSTHILTPEGLLSDLRDLSN